MAANMSVQVTARNRGRDVVDKFTFPDILSFMPRQTQIDTPGLLQYVIVRRSKSTDIFLNDEDREDFVERLTPPC